MPHRRSRLRHFLAELRRRKVLRALLIYLLAAWLVVQVVATTWQAIGLPPGTLTVVLLLAAAGLPIVVALTWAYEIVPTRSELADGAQDDEVAVSLAEAAGIPTLLRRMPAGARSGGGVRLPETLPSPASPFIGRRAELGELATLLEDARCRLITVTGPGGVGKTRVALEAAQACSARFRHGVAFVPLSGLRSAELIAAAIAEALGITLGRREDQIRELSDYLRAKEMLVVLDNFEHLMAGVPVVAALLDAAPRVHLLVTSRERLDLTQETLLPLAGLATTVADDAVTEAAQLFTAHAHRLDPAFVPDAAARRCIQRIGELLNGIPLAIELAAAWVRVLSCDEIIVELERGLDILSSSAADLPERHRSLRATFDSSWRLLSAAERRALAGLSVFRSSFDREAAGAVADADAALLRSLVDKSLVSRAGGRFLLLDVIRQFAGRRLQEQADVHAAALDRHAGHFMALLASQRHALARSSPEAIRRVADSIEDVRVAWVHAAERGDTRAVEDAIDALYHFYETRGWAQEGETSFGLAAAQLRAATAADREAADRARLAARLDARRAVCFDRLGDHAAAETLLRGCLEHARAVGEPHELVFVLEKLGANSLLRGEFEPAEQLQQEALALAESLGEPHAIAWSLTSLGNVNWSRGNYDAAGQYYRRALALHRSDGDRNGLWVVLNNLGAIAGMQHQTDEAKRFFEEALVLQVELGNRRSAVHLLHNLGVINVRSGDYAAAEEQLNAACAIAEEMGYRTLLAHALVAVGDLDRRRGAFGPARETIARALRIAAEARSYPIALQALLCMARLANGEGDGGRAASLARIVAGHPASEKEERDEAAALLAELGESAPAAGAGEHAGRGLELDEAITEILASELPAART
jgi:predicted ATPase/Tfp pilus assembly protein PilF